MPLPFQLSPTTPLPLSLLPPTPLPLPLLLLSRPSRLRPPLLLPSLMLLLLPPSTTTLPLLLQLSSPPPPLSNTSAIRFTTRSTTCPRSPSRSTLPPTPPTTSSTTLPSSVPSPTVSSLSLPVSQSLLLLKPPLPLLKMLPQLLRKLKSQDFIRIPLHRIEKRLPNNQMRSLLTIGEVASEFLLTLPTNKLFLIK